MPLIHIARLSRTCVACAAVAALALVGVATPAQASGNFFQPGAVAIDAHGHVWVANNGTFGLTEIDASTGKILRIVNPSTDDFNNISDLSIYGNELWVVNEGTASSSDVSNSGVIDELNATTGAQEKIIDLASSGVTGLRAVATDRLYVWVSADGGNKVVELSRTSGAILHVESTGPNHVDSTTFGIYDDGVDVYLPSPRNQTHAIVERDDATGARARAISPSKPNLVNGKKDGVLRLDPVFVVRAGGALWSVNLEGVAGTLFGSLSQINPSTGRIIRSITPKGAGFSSPVGLYAHGDNLWVANAALASRGGNSVTELNATTGALVRVIKLKDPGQVSTPDRLAGNGKDLFISDDVGNVIELDLATGKVVGIIN